MPIHDPCPSARSADAGFFADDGKATVMHQGGTPVAFAIVLAGCAADRGRDDLPKDERDLTKTGETRQEGDANKGTSTAPNDQAAATPAEENDESDAKSGTEESSCPTGRIEPRKCPPHCERGQADETGKILCTPM
jgi:hypothetical protein